jgi:WD40 repeat protein
MVTSVAALTLDGRAALASGSYDNTLRLWDATSGVQLATTGGSFANLAISPTETEGRLLTGGSGGCVFVGFDVDAVHGDTRVKGAKFHSIILDHEIAGILLDYQSDFATGQSRATAIGPNAWRGFIAVGHDAAGCQSLRPIEDMLLG